MTMQHARVIAVIPARGGSKGIPRKNLRLLAGKPLLAYSVEHAKRTPAINRVLVSTDDAEIAEVAHRWDAEVIPRPAEISGDTASSESALLHALNQLRDAESYEADLVVFLQATSPLRRPYDIQNAIEALQREGADSLFSACVVEGYVWRSGLNGLVPLNYDPANRKRRQELEDRTLQENGSIYVFKPWVLRDLKCRLGGRIAVYPMDVIDSFQVDKVSDLELMEHLIGLRRMELPVPDLSQIEMLVLDFDGVITDNRVLVREDGTEAVWCDRGDGLGIAALKQAGLEVLVISKEANPVVGARCGKLALECIQGCDEKLSALKTIAERRGLSREQVAYVGNDVNDLECLKWAGVSIVVADSVAEVRHAARWVTTKPGGRGAVREVCDLILGHRRTPTL